MAEFDFLIFLGFVKDALRVYNAFSVCFKHIGIIFSQQFDGKIIISASNENNNVMCVFVLLLSNSDFKKKSQSIWVG